MRRFRELEGRNQVALIPATIDEYVPRGDIVRYVDELVESFDLDVIERGYSTLGRPAYAPKVLVKVLLYGKMRGVRSGRELSRACEENFRFIFLCQNEKPDFRTINGFRKRFSGELATLLRQTIEIGLKEGLIKLENVSIDGTKIGAFAGRNSFKDPVKLKEELLKLEEEIKESIEKDIEVDEDEDRRLGGGSGSDALPPELQKKDALRKKIEKALAEYESIEGEKPKSVSVTEPECRFMKSKGVNPAWNGQAAIDADSRMVIGGYVTKATCDGSELISVLEDVESNTKQEVRNVIADKGYNSHEDLKKLREKSTEGWISQRIEPVLKFEYNKEKDTYTCPVGEELKCVYNWKDDKRYQSKACATCNQWRLCCARKKRRKQLVVSHHVELTREMRDKMETEVGRGKRILRSSTIEPLFGILKFAKKLRQFYVRGMAFVNDMWKLELAAYNVEKLCRVRMG